MPFAENLGTGGGSLDAQYGSSPTANTNAPLLLDPRTSGNFVYTPGTAGNYVAVPHSSSLNILGTEGTPRLNVPSPTGNRATTPDTAALDITGNIEVVCRATRPAPVASSMTLVNKMVSTGSQYSWTFQFFSTDLYFIATTGGTSATQYFLNSSTVSLSVGTIYWWKATLNVATTVITLQWAPDSPTEPTVWTTLASAPVAGATSIFSGSADLAVGGQPGGADCLQGDIYRAIVRDGIGGTTVFDADFTQQALGSRGFIESTGKLVSLVGNAAQIVDGTTYGTMPQSTSAQGWSVPDSAALDVSDLEITARLSMNNWTAGVNKTVVAKYDNGSGSGSYIFYISTNAQPFAQYKVGGVVQPLVAGTNYPFVNGGTYWVRVRRIAATGVWRFYWAADSETEPTVWTNVGGDIAGTAGALDNSTALTTIGAFNNLTNAYISQGRFYRAIIRNANTGGTKVLDADFTRQLQFASTFTEGSSQLATVTTVGAARIERDRDLDLRVRVAMDDWTPGSNLALAAKMAGQKSYILMALTSGNLYFGWSAEGTTELSAQSSPTGIADGTVKWVRVTLDVNNGSNGHTVSFFTSDDGATWAPLSSVPLTGATSIFPSTMPVEVGTYGLGTLSPLAGKVFNAEIRNGIDGPAVLDIDFTDAITTGAETYLLDTPSEVIPEAEQYLPNLGYGGTVLNARFGSAVGADTNDPLLLTHTGTNYLYLPGGSNDVAQAPHLAAYNVGNEIDVRIYCAMDNWSGNNSRLIDRSFGDPNWQFNISTQSNGRLQFAWFPLATVASGIGVQSAPHGIRDGADKWVRVTFTANDGSGGRLTRFFLSDDGVTWALLSEHTGTATTLASVTSPLYLGSNLWAGKLYRAQVRNGIAGTVVFDANFTTGITSGAQTTFTESSTNAATVTINRSTSGRKSVAVVQDVLLFGTDDYLEVPDNDLLDFGANASFTVMTAARAWNVGGGGEVLVSKTASPGGANAGYSLYRVTGAGNQVVGAIGDGAVSSFQVANDSALGTLTTRVLIRDTGADTIGVSIGGAAPVSGVDATTATLSNTTALQVGRGGGGLWANMEWRGSAVWRRVLTAAEVALVNTHYTTGPTAASTALMQQAVFWVDAGTRSVAQINRALIGSRAVACARCVWAFGTDDFFEVPASDLFNFDQGEDYTLLVVNRAWPNQQGTDRALMATQSSATASAPGWALSTAAALSTEQGNFANHGKAGDGSNGVTAIAPAKFIGQLSATWLVRNTLTDTFTAYQGSAAGTPVTDVTTGTIGNTNVMRIGRLSSTGTNYLNGEIVAAVVWRRALTTAERNAVLAYYGV